MNLTAKVLSTIVLFLCFQVTRGQTLLEIRQEIDQYEAFTSLETAAKQPEKVFRLKLNDIKVDERFLAKQLPKFTNLRELVLNNTNISEVPSSIGKLKKLQFLEIGHLQTRNPNLRKLPRSVSRLKEIVYINLIGNPNLDWDGTFTILSKLPKLINIALMHNGFTKLPDGVTKLRALKMIWLGKNPDLNLKDAFIKLAKLDHLQQMGLGGSGYRRLPREVALLKHIENLWLSGNKWESLDGLQYLPALSQVSLHNCELSNFPKTLIQCSQLEYLSLVGNPRLDFDRVLSELPPSVQILNLGNNQIEKLSISGLQRTNLKEIMLNDNHLSEADLAEIQKGNPKLKIHG